MKATSPLLLASQKGHIEVVRVLLSAKATVDLQNKLGASPLFLAWYVVRALHSAGAQPDLHAFNGKTPLDVLPRALHTQVKRLLHA